MIFPVAKKSSHLGKESRIEVAEKVNNRFEINLKTYIQIHTGMLNISPSEHF